MCFILHRPLRTAVRIHVVPSLLASWMSIKKPQEKSHGGNLAIFLRFGKNLILQLVAEFVPDAPDGQDILRRVRIGLNFLSQFSDECHNVAVIQ